jgi:hypothetical protein
MAGTPLRYLTTWERTVPAEFVLLEKRERFPGKYLHSSQCRLPLLVNILKIQKSLQMITWDKNFFNLTDGLYMLRLKAK